MNVFMQGMRRSGTTIVYDILCQDKEFVNYYEPFAAAREGALGGGSGVQPVDLFSRIRTIRAEFRQLHPEITDEMLNYGAPTKPALEFEPDMPEYCKDYLRLMMSKAADTVFKFTRMYCKINMLRELDPRAKFVHLIRDPRAVTASYLYGGKKRLHRHYQTEAEFFSRRSNINSWKFRDFTDHLIARPEYSHLAGCEDFMRVLLLWKYTFQQTFHGGTTAFGDDYLLLHHEDLTNTPEPVLRGLYDHFERPLPGPVIAWAWQNVRQTSHRVAPLSGHWRRAFRTVGMEQELEHAGYGYLLDDRGGA